MKQFAFNVLQLHQLLPSVLLVICSLWIFQSGRDAWMALQVMHWSVKPPELPGAPVQPAQLASAVALTATRDRPVFWESRRPPPVAGGGAASVEPPRLVGIVIESGEATWVVLSQGSQPQRRVFRLKVGQTVGVYTIKAARPDEVVLLGPTGEIQLRPPRVAAP